MNTNPLMKLNDGRSMQQLGFGLWQVSNQEATAATLEAFKVGYRSIDSAAIYQNESGLGQAIAQCGLKREELFITTKLWNSEQGYDSALRAFDQSLKKLGLKEVDLYLIHWPAPKKGLFVESWKALIELQKQGRAKSIGVSNFTIPQLQRLLDETGKAPVLNQVELHPRFQQKELRAFHAQNNILTEAWSPLGQGQLLTDPVLSTIAKKHGKSTAQVILRWHLDQGIIAIPKSVTPSRIKENFQVFDFKLDADDLSQINKLDSTSGRIGPDPDTADF